MPPNSACQNILNAYATIDYQGVFPSVFSVPLNFTLTITGGSGNVLLRTLVIEQREVCIMVLQN